MLKALARAVDLTERSWVENRTSAPIVFELLRLSNNLDEFSEPPGIVEEGAVFTACLLTQRKLLDVLVDMAFPGFDHPSCPRIPGRVFYPAGFAAVRSCTIDCLYFVPI